MALHHHQITGDQMKFITICDSTGIIECELFASHHIIADDFPQFRFVWAFVGALESFAEMTRIKP